jgi:hypothetical protein
MRSTSYVIIHTITTRNPCVTCRTTLSLVGLDAPDNSRSLHTPLVGCCCLRPDASRSRGIRYDSAEAAPVADNRLRAGLVRRDMRGGYDVEHVLESRVVGANPCVGFPQEVQSAQLRKVCAR